MRVERTSLSIVGAGLYALAALLWSVICVADAKAQAEWVEQVYLDPSSISLPVNEDLHVVLGRTRHSPSELEFRVHQTRDSEWFVLRDWSEWPLAPLQSAVVGSSAIQIDIRHKDGGAVQKEWIGTYFFREANAQYPSLYRVISSTLFDVDDRSSLSAKTAQRASLIFSLLADETASTCLNQCEREKQEDGTVVVRQDELALTYDPRTQRVSWPNAPIDIKLSRFPQYAELRGSLEGLDPEYSAQTLLIAYAVQFIHRGFWVGSPSEGMIRSHFDVVSMCNTYSYTLIRMLRELGVKAEFVSYTNALNGAHAIVQVKTPKGTMLLDAMEGRIVFGSIEDVVAGKKVEQVSLPSFQSTGIDLVADLPTSKGIWITESIDMNRGQAMHSNPVVIKPGATNP